MRLRVGPAVVVYALGAAASFALVAASATHRVNLSLTEVLAFITGAVTVWLTVKQNVWNWPIGIANSAFFAVLFWRTALFADMALQVVYIVLGFLGWYWWLFGGPNRTELHVRRTPLAQGLLLVVVTVAATYGLTMYLRTVHDAAPFWDALTTVMSLVAQYLLTKKFIENWGVWITADVIYIGLYAYKHLYLTSVLYAIFMLMCVAGLAEWQKSRRSDACTVMP